MAGTNDTAPGDPADADGRLRVIRKLLARAEGTEFPDERDACLAKVAELAARYSLDEALVWARRPAAERDRPVERLLEVPDPYAARKVTLYASVGANHSCRVIDVGTGHDRVRRVAVIGFPRDVERVEVLVTSLLLQLTTSMLAGRPPARRPSASATAAWRRSFISGFVARVDERLAEAARAERRRHDRDPAAPRTDGATSTSVVLADRSAAVAEEVRRRYPRLRTSWMDAGSSPAGNSAGRSAGDRASIDGSALAGGRRALGA